MTDLKVKKDYVSTIIDQETAKILKYGFIKYIDILLLLIKIVIFIGFVSWLIFGKITVLGAAIFLIIDINISFWWALSLMYRNIYFALRILFQIENMPIEASKLTYQYILNASATSKA